MQGKVISRKLARVGGLVYTIVVETKPATDKAPAETREYTSMLTTEQITTANLCGMKLPVLNDVVVVEPSVNPATGLVNEQWVNISL